VHARALDGWCEKFAASTDSELLLLCTHQRIDAMKNVAIRLQKTLHERGKVESVQKTRVSLFA
jgi:hypothetical protein